MLRTACGSTFRRGQKLLTGLGVVSCLQLNDRKGRDMQSGLLDGINNAKSNRFHKGSASSVVEHQEGYIMRSRHAAAHGAGTQ